MKSKIVGILAAVAAFTAFSESFEIDAETQKKLDAMRVVKTVSYRLHLHQRADGSEDACIVGADGVERFVIILDPYEYRLLTNRFEKVWQTLHATADGRRKIHGKLERTEIDEKARQKVEIYTDGFRYTETLPVKRKPTEAKITRLQAKIEERKPKGMSNKRWEMRQAFKKRRLGVPKQVTIEHDAVTGKDTVVK